MKVITGGNTLRAVPPIRAVPRVVPSTHQIRELPRTLEAEHGTGRRRRSVDTWLMGVMVACSVLFAAALTRYLFVPALTTIAVSSVDTSNTDGP